MSVNEQRKKCAEVKSSSGRCWTSRHNSLLSSDPTANVFISTASHLITWASVLKSGGRRLIPVRSFIQMTDRGTSVILTVESLKGLHTGLGCGCVKFVEMSARS